MKKILTIICALVLSMACIFGLTACGEQPKVKLVSVALTQEEYAFAMKLDNTALQTSFNEYLAEIKDNGTFDAIMAKYFENKGTKVGYSFVGDGLTSNAEGTTGAGKFVVATNCPFSPFEYIENGKIYGVDMEIAAGYAQKHGLELIIKNIDFDAILPALDSNYADIGMAGMTVTPDRSNYLFTTKYYNASLNIIVSANNTDFDACTTKEEVEVILSNLSGKKIGYQSGTTAVDYVEGFSNIEGKKYDTAAIATYDVINGNIYAVIVDNAPAAAIVASYNNN
jgi:polar amino acid transport system substrate-binding protein